MIPILSRPIIIGAKSLWLLSCCLTLFSVTVVAQITPSQQEEIEKRDKAERKAMRKHAANAGIPYNMKSINVPVHFDQGDWKQFHKLNSRKVNPRNPATSPWLPVPFKIDYTGGSYGAQGVGVIRSIAMQPGNNNRVIAGTLLAGLWLTTDKGVTWQQVGTELPLVETVYGIRFAPGNTSIVYAATNAGPVKSTNGGLTWSYCTNFLNTLPYNAVEQMIDVSPTDPNKVFICVKNNVATQGGIYTSNNGGSSWTTLQQNKAFWDVKVHPTNPNIVYALQVQSSPGWWCKFLRSTDGGVTFTEISSGYPAAPIPGRMLLRGAIAVSPAKPDYVYVYCGGYLEYGLWRSTDAGVNFTKRDPGWPGDTQLTVNLEGTDYTFDNRLTAGYGQTGWDFALAVSATNADMVFAGCNKTMYSTNGGTTWSHVGNPNQTTWPIHGDIQGIAAQGSDLWVVSDGGAYLSTDSGRTAIQKHDGINAAECWGFSTAFKSDIMAAGVNHNAIFIKDTALYDDWLTAPGADAQTATVNPLDDRYIYAMPWWDTRLTRTTARNTPPGSIGNLQVYSGYVNYQNFKIHPNLYNKIFVVGHSHGSNTSLVKGITVSHDNALTWSALKPFSDISGGGGRMEISMADPSTMYAIVQRNSLARQVWKTNDDGASWTDVSPSAALTSGLNMYNVALSDKDTNKVWMVMSAASGVKVLRTSDGGANWSDYSTGLPATPGAFGIVYQRGTNDGIYIGTRMGVYYRNASMSAWQLHGTGMMAGEVNFLQINYAIGKLRAGTSRGMWQCDLYEDFVPAAQFGADKNVIDCSVGTATVQFKDYSALTQSGASWSWSFPGGNPSVSTAENPVVSYAAASAGKYSVTLTVTDGQGRTSTKTLNNFIDVTGNCATGCWEAIPRTQYSVYQFSSQETSGEDAPATRTIDGNIDSHWVTQWSGGSPAAPHYVAIDLGGTYDFQKLTYTPRQNNQNGRINAYAVHTSTDGTTWSPAATGNFANSVTPQHVVLATKVAARYVKLTANSEVNGNPWIAVGELTFFGCPQSCVITPVPRTHYSVDSYDSQEVSGEIAPATHAIDGNNATRWVTGWTGATAQMPHYITINLGAVRNVAQMTYVPRQDNVNGRIKDYKIETRSTGSAWTLVKQGTWTNTNATQVVDFDPVPAQYVRVTATSEVNNGPWTSIAELSFGECGSGSSLVAAGRSENARKTTAGNYMSIYPVPATTRLRVIPDLPKADKADMRIIDAVGREHKIQRGIKADSPFSVSIAELKPGIYYLVLTDKAGKSYTGRFIKE